MASYQINDIIGFAFEVQNEWHTTHRRLTAVNQNETFSNLDKLQESFECMSDFYIRVAELLRKYDPTNIED